MWISCSPMTGAISVSVGMSWVESAMRESSVNVGRQALAGQLVAVALQAREGDLAGDALLEGAHPGRHARRLRRRLGRRRG